MWSKMECSLALYNVAAAIILLASPLEAVTCPDGYMVFLSGCTRGIHRGTQKPGRIIETLGLEPVFTRKPNRPIYTQPPVTTKRPRPDPEEPAPYPYDDAGMGAGIDAAMDSGTATEYSAVESHGESAEGNRE